MTHSLCTFFHSIWFKFYDKLHFDKTFLKEMVFEKPISVWTCYIPKINDHCTCSYFCTISHWIKLLRCPHEEFLRESVHLFRAHKGDKFGCQFSSFRFKWKTQFFVKMHYSLCTCWTRVTYWRAKSGVAPCVTFLRVSSFESEISSFESEIRVSS